MKFLFLFWFFSPLFKQTAKSCNLEGNPRRRPFDTEQENNAQSFLDNGFYEYPNFVDKQINNATLIYSSFHTNAIPFRSNSQRFSNAIVSEQALSQTAGPRTMKTKI